MHEENLLRQKKKVYIKRVGRISGLLVKNAQSRERKKGNFLCYHQCSVKPSSLSSCNLHSGWKLSRTKSERQRRKQLKQKILKGETKKCLFVVVLF